MDIVIDGPKGILDQKCQQNVHKGKSTCWFIVVYLHLNV